MSELDAALAVVAVLDELGAEYMVSGSFASNFWGSPRSTQDVDVVVRVDSLNLGAFFDRLEEDFESDRQLRFEGVTATHRYVIEHRKTHFRGDVFILTDDPFDQARFARRVKVDLAGKQVAFSTAEDAAVQKLLWLKRSGDQKHLKDVRAILLLQRSSLDWEYIHRWTDQHGTRALLEEILRSIESP